MSDSASTEMGLAEAPADRTPAELKKFLLWVMLPAVLLYAASVNSHWRFQRDSAVYLDLARSMLEGRGYQHNYAVETGYPPAFPLLLATVGAVFGMPDTLAGNYLPMNLVLSVMGLGCIVLLYLIVRRLSLPAHAALAIVLLYAFSRTQYYYSTHLMTDVPFTLFALAALWAGLTMLQTEGRRSWAWCVAGAVMVVVATFIRAVGPLLGIALVAGLWVRRGSLRAWRPNLAKTVVIMALLVASLMLWAWWTQAAGAPEGPTYTRDRVNARLFEVMISGTILKFPKHLNGISDAVFGTSVGGTIGLVLFALMAAGVVRSLRRERVLSFFALMELGVVIGLGYALRRRYMLPALPVMLCWLVLGADAVGGWLRRRHPFWTRNRVATLGYVCLCLVLLVNFIRIGKVILESRSPRFYEVVDGGRAADYEDLIAWLRHNARHDQAVLCYESTFIHYFTRVRTVHLPRDTRDLPVEWMVAKIDKESIHFLVTDSRMEGSAAVIRRLAEGHADSVSRVLRGGRVQLLRVSHDALPALRPPPPPDEG